MKDFKVKKIIIWVIYLLILFGSISYIKKLEKEIIIKKNNQMAIEMGYEEFLYENRDEDNIYTESENLQETPEALGDLTFNILDVKTEPMEDLNKIYYQYVVQVDNDYSESDLIKISTEISNSLSDSTDFGGIKISIVDKLSAEKFFFLK